MSARRTFIVRVRGLVGGGERDADLLAEIDAHIDEAAHEFTRQGVPAGEARRLAKDLPIRERKAESSMCLRCSGRLPASDPVTFGAVAVALTAIALFACYVPARRAPRIDPIATLRSE